MRPTPETIAFDERLRAQVPPFRRLPFQDFTIGYSSAAEQAPDQSDFKPQRLDAFRI
jgi:hypothetical protein